MKWNAWNAQTQNTRTVIGKQIRIEEPEIKVDEEVTMSKKQSRKRIKSSEDRRAAKKATVLRTEKKSLLPLIAIFAGAAVVVVIALVFLSRMGREPNIVASSLEDFMRLWDAFFDMVTSSSTLIVGFLVKIYKKFLLNTTQLAGWMKTGSPKAMEHDIRWA